MPAGVTDLNIGSPFRYDDGEKVAAGGKRKRGSSASQYQRAERVAVLRSLGNKTKRDQAPCASELRASQLGQESHHRASDALTRGDHIGGAIGHVSRPIPVRRFCQPDRWSEEGLAGEVRDSERHQPTSTTHDVRQVIGDASVKGEGPIVSLNRKYPDEGHDETMSVNAN